MNKTIVCLMASLSICSIARAASIQFVANSENVVTSLIISDLSFTISGDYTDSQLQLRMLDTYSSIVGTTTSVLSSGLTVSGNGTTYNLPNSVTRSWDTLGGSSSQSDIIMFFGNENSENMSIRSAQTYTISGTVTLSESTGSTYFATPDSLDGCTVYIASAYDGDNLSGFLTVTTSIVPEPSTYAAFAGLGALGLALLRRRKA